MWDLVRIPLWLDELDTAEGLTDGLASHSWEPAGLPYQALICVWSIIGTGTDAGLRFPSVAAAAVAVAVTALTAGRLAGSKSGLAAGLFLAVMPSVARYAQEARTYEIVLAASAGATLSLVVALDNRALAWIPYGALVAVIGVLHPVSLSLLVGHTVLVTKTRGVRLDRRWLSAVAVGVLPAAFMFYLGRSSYGLYGWILRPTLPRAVPEIVGVVVSGSWLSRTGLIVACVLTVFAIVNRDGRWWLAAFLSPVTVVWIYSYLQQSIWVGRYMLGLAPLLAVAASFVFARVRYWQVVGAAAILVVLVIPQWRAERTPGARGIDYREAARVIQEQLSATDSFWGVGTWEQHYAWYGTHRYLSDDVEIPLVSQPVAGTWSVGIDPGCATMQSYAIAGGVVYHCTS
jgi:mannosyltransferase